MKIHKTKRNLALSLAAAAALLAACGGGFLANVGGQLTGLGSGLSVTLQNNLSDKLTLSSNQSFTFPTTLAAGASYSVTVLTQPTGQTCTVSNGSGTINTQGNSVTNVAVSCTSTVTLGGTLSGLPTSTLVTLLNQSGSTTTTLTTNGPFTLQGSWNVGASYSIVVSQQPSGHTCVVTNGSGVVSASGNTAINVSCQ
ncbi:MAG: hypothetical protein JOY84_08330 [Curvibacter sp.]|nr:hypothetical protein [Curvibacter sp.]